MLNHRYKCKFVSAQLLKELRLSAPKPRQDVKTKEFPKGITPKPHAYQDEG
jgi:hypothetical protein